MKARKIILASACLVLLVIAIIQAVASRIDPVKILTLKNEIDEVLIERPEGDLHLIKQGEDWFVGDKKYTGNFNACENLADKFAEVKLLGKVTKSDNEAVLAKYDLNDEKVYKVSVYSEGKTLRTFRVGKTTSTNSQVYMMVDGSNDIYMAAGTLQNDCAKSINDLRSKVVIQIDKDSIQSVTVDKAENADEDVALVYGEWTLTRGSEGNVYSIAGETVPSDFELDDDKAATWFGSCASLAATDWLPDGAEIPAEKLLKVRMVLSDRTITLDLYQGADDDGTEMYWGKCSESPYAFKVAKYSVQKFQKNPGDFSK